MNKLSLLFHSGVRADVLRLLFGVRSERMYRAEIIGRTQFAPASVEEELHKLVELDLLNHSKDGNRWYYTANVAHPLFPELQGIVLKSLGLPVVRRPVREAAARAPRRRAEAPARNPVPPSAVAAVADLGVPFDGGVTPETIMHLR